RMWSLWALLRPDLASLLSSSMLRITPHFSTPWRGPVVGQYCRCIHYRVRPPLTVSLVRLRLAVVSQDVRLGNIPATRGLVVGVKPNQPQQFGLILGETEAGADCVDSSLHLFVFHVANHSFSVPTVGGTHTNPYPSESTSNLS